jgi:hypothetical protein
LTTGRETTWKGYTGHVHGLAFTSGTCAGYLWGRRHRSVVGLAGSEARVRTIGPGPFGGGVRSVAFTPDGAT